MRQARFKITLLCLFMATFVFAAAAGAADNGLARQSADDTLDNAASGVALIAPAGRAPTRHVAPESVLYDNGPLVTCPGCGNGGADVSELQIGLGMSTLGFAHQLTANTRVADDFTIPAGETWTIDQITFYAYQTNSTITSTITHVNLRIWDGVPDDGVSSVVFGDTTTNRLASTEWSGIYRTAEDDLLSSERPIMANVVTVGIVLSEGTYWLDWQSDGTLSSGPFVSPITLLGQTTTGNARRTINGNPWGGLIDVGPQGLPFVIEGTSPVDVDVTSTGATTIPVCGGRLTFDLTASNNTASPMTTTVWTTITLPGGEERLAMNPRALTLAGQASKTLATGQRIRGTAPAGEYSYNVYAGTYPDGIVASDSLSFTKEAGVCPP